MEPYVRPRFDNGVDSKIVVMGNSGVGKTSLLQRYTQNKFDSKNTTSTSGAFFVTKKVHVNGLKVRLQLWDTAGQERFRSMVRPSLCPVHPPPHEQPRRPCIIEVRASHRSNSTLFTLSRGKRRSSAV